MSKKVSSKRKMKGGKPKKQTRNKKQLRNKSNIKKGGANPLLKKLTGSFSRKVNCVQEKDFYDYKYYKILTFKGGKKLDITFGQHSININYNKKVTGEISILELNDLLTGTEDFKNYDTVIMVYIFSNEEIYFPLGFQNKLNAEHIYESINETINNNNKEKKTHEINFNQSVNCPLLFKKLIIKKPITPSQSQEPVYEVMNLTPEQRRRLEAEKRRTQGPVYATMINPNGERALNLETITGESTV